MTTLAADRSDRFARKAERALTVATVLGGVEILRRSPRLLVVLAALLVYTVVMFALVYMVWLDVVLGTIAAWKLGRGMVQGSREAR